ncbi:xanthine dehydrogenase family protein molybdopterin-binding subunit [Rhodoferax sp.]|uniref:xanthine dehydrogenase family protein molybdopterin-binding subunit n=1 Tax=Rhodoferax sp. TaxID=50421 RepID=UPI0025FC26C1|nr:xanthine dehydrogenase family protein molybdopterin-binding subunit [Rhodoferax sp.]MCM2340917.1 xanthine dehydrogenase family protein molybdopterin-binding subunit [Rhodoferax sp.]
MVTRRSWLLGTVATTGALVVGWSLMPVRQRLTGAQPLSTGPGQNALNGWVKIGVDNSVTVMMSKSEMGQGVHTGLAMLLAEELDADWAQVRVEHAPIDAIYNNLSALVDGLPFHPDDDSALKATAQWLTAKLMREFGVMMTGGSSSIKDLWLPMREAGASARAMLIEAASRQWQLPATECTASLGRVTHMGGQSASFGELAQAASQLPLPEAPQLKNPAQFTLIGNPRRRLEAAPKLDGSAIFGMDVLPPGLLYASVTMCPTLGGRVASFQADAAAKLPGVRQVLKVDGYNGGTGGVAVVADTPYHASQALAQVSIEWHHGSNATLDSADVLVQLTQTLDREDGWAYYKHGDVSTALASASKTVTADYQVPYLAHTPMEPMNCTVQFKDGAATVWASTQVPGLARAAAAKALGFASDKVTVQVQFLGGGFGRRLDVDFIGQAAAIAKVAGGAPVQTFWSREQDITHDFYRPACVSRFVAGLDAKGALTAWKNTSVSQAIVPQVLKRLFNLPSAGPDKTTAEGAFDQPYEWPNARIAHEMVALGVPVGFWRSVGHSHQAFFKECFMDEVALAAGQDPVAFRAALLQRHPRPLKVLQQVATMSGWGQAFNPAPGALPRARGVALHQSFGSVVAQVAEVSVDADQKIRVHKVWCVIDCGFAVNPNLIRQQLDSAIVFGLSAALGGEITIVNGQVQQSNFHDYPMLRMGECPVIESHIMASTEPPEGVGEPGTPPIAPAVANAVFALTGKRLRALPLKLA